MGTLEVALHRDWLLFETHVVQYHLDMFCERGPTRPPENFGRVNAVELEQLMWPDWIRAYRTPAVTDDGTSIPGCCAFLLVFHTNSCGVRHQQQAVQQQPISRCLHFVNQMKI